MRYAVTLLIVGLSVAQADILHLHNGRTLEGQIVRRTPKLITLKMNHGRMVVRSDQIREIERRLRPEHELAERYRQIDPSNPLELERLSLWASKRGLGRESSDLSDHARGIRLERKLDAIRDSRQVSDWLDVYTWARVNDVSQTVQQHLLSTASAIDAADPTLVAVLAAREDEARAAARRQAEIERRRGEPIFKMPNSGRSGGVAIRTPLIPVVDEVDREARESRVKRLPGESADSDGADADTSATDARIRELEARLEDQEERTREQEELAVEQEAELQRLRRLRVRRRGRRNTNATGPSLLRANKSSGSGLLRAKTPRPATPPPVRAKPTVR